MKLSKLYSNAPSIFGPVKFIPGLNVVLAEIRLPEIARETPTIWARRRLAEC
jgi:uncharacterized protein YydD (DUF2326 family)